MQQELSLWLTGFFAQFFGLFDQPAPVLPSLGDDLDLSSPRPYATGCQVCKTRLWTAHKPPERVRSSSEPPPPAPQEWTHEYSRDGRRIYHDVCSTCLKRLKQDEEQERREKRNERLAEIRRRHQRIYDLKRKIIRAV
jgi:hypothetical protein